MKEFGRGCSHYGSFIVDGRGTILGFDQALEELTGWPAIEVVGHGKDLNLGSRPSDNGSIRTIPLYEGQVPMGPREGNLVLFLNCRDGRRLDVEARTRPLEGPGSRVHLTVLRVLASSSAERGLPDHESRDPLTGLPDREAFSAQFAADFAEAAARARPLALVMLDVDHLREINDRLGREAGDEVLKKISGILRVTIEDERRVARLGNDDFAVLLRGAGRGEARRRASALRSTVERFGFFNERDRDHRRPVTVTLGAASFPADADTQNELLERAREALDEARAMGRNRVWCYLRRPRVPLQVPVYFDGTDPLLVGYTRDLSPSGIFVQTTAGIEVGMRCALTFPLPGHDGKVHVVGRVVRTVHPSVSTDSGDLRIPGLGVEFERFGGDRDRRAIDCFLHAHESTTLRPEDGILSV